MRNKEEIPVLVAEIKNELSKLDLLSQKLSSLDLTDDKLSCPPGRLNIIL